MTNSDAKMNCSDIDKELKHFIGDLLSDTDYQAYVEHLSSCPKCASRVRSIGSFSNQLWELGDIEIPSDLDATILFQFNQAKQQPRKSKYKGSKKLVFGVIIVIVGLILAFGGKKFFKPAETEVDEEGDDEVIVKVITTKNQSSVSNQEAEQLYGQLQKMADSLESISSTKTDKKTPEKTISKMEDPSPLDKSPESDKTSISNSFPLHWHIPNFTESDIKQLLDTISMLNIDLDYNDQNRIIFKTTSRKAKTLSEEIQFTNKIQLDLPEFIIDGSDPEREVVASISFTE